MPAAEFDIDATLVHQLLADQFPELAGSDIVELANGWDNVMFRLGDDLTVRLPRRQAAVPLIDNEQRCLDILAPRLAIPVPAPLYRGVPSVEFPMPWSICPWFPGEMASDVPLAEPPREARRLGALLVALHQPAPTDAPENPFRGQDVRGIEHRVVENLSKLQRDDADDLIDRWRGWAMVEPHQGPPMWLHGDLHTANMLVDRGTISAVIDFGDVTSGDPAVDFPVAWMLFDREARYVFRQAASHSDDALWSRARAWALHFALMYLANSADNPRLHAMGERLLAALTE